MSNHAVHLKQIPSCSDDDDSDAVNQYSLCKRIVSPRDSGPCSSNHARDLRQLEYEHTGLACVKNIGKTTTESPLGSSGTCENSSNNGSLVISDQYHSTLPNLRYFRYMDFDEPYTCREILKKHLRTKQPGQSDTSTPSGPITPEVATASENASFPTASSDNLQISHVRLLIPSDDMTGGTVTYLLDVTWMIKRWEHLPVIEEAVCDGDDEGLPSD
ncbi:hypothetical protein GJ496_000740 [Pomphorhynchus laevis]|nr:hypothetical protein GJ496_000740 [Pomphorhynchus laevis]